MGSEQNQDFEAMLCWGRYLYWANICKGRYDLLFETYSAPTEIPAGEYFAYTSQWFASLHVVIEGWKTLNPKDETIDIFLTEFEPLQDLLRRYRNGVFHFQPSLLDKRFTGFAKSNYDWAQRRGTPLKCCLTRYSWHSPAYHPRLGRFNQVHWNTWLVR